ALPPHRDRHETVIAAWQEVLQAAYAANPERFVHNPPVPQALPRSAWTNPPGKDEEEHKTATLIS
ncbi:MAG: hypothetical protein KJ822_12040, partial [Proteobacteria bacterium]|nr:hypothetical protein [Pseudomonadota bacterium]